MKLENEELKPHIVVSTISYSTPPTLYNAVTIAIILTNYTHLHFLLMDDNITICKVFRVMCQTC